MPALPSGTVTFLFTDIQGSTRLWENHPEAMAAALARHDQLLRAAVAAHDGRVIKTTGDGLHAVFAQASAGAAAALAAQQSLTAEPWPGLPQPLQVRMGLHAGEAQLREGDYYGSATNRAARLMALAAGGQVLLSSVVATLVQDKLPPGAALVPLGEHRLKDLVRPERLFQLNGPGLPDSFPPLRSLNALPNNLPIQPTSFIGRERELAEARRLLASTRLLTLIGPGGTGKTRLSLQLAAEVLEAYADGVWLVELAALAEPALVPQAVADIWNVRAQPGRPLLETVTDYLRAKELLLVLDNCEHLVEACAHLATTLLAACPRLTLLPSSREALGVAGETAYRVPSLSLPDARQTPSLEASVQSEAVRLFAERAQAVQPSFALTAHNLLAVTQICQRLDGIPLALELAAARTRLLAVDQIALRLDDRFRLLTGGSRTALPRQQTLRALIDWSYDLLAPDEQSALARLSVFAGGWSLDAAEAVLGADSLDLLGRLVDKSLVVVEQPAEAGVPRYRLLETIRQYARDKLLESGQAAPARDAHLAYFVEYACALEPRIFGPDMVAAEQALEDELDNLRAALEWSIGANPHAALQLVNSLNYLWQHRGLWAEGRRWIQEALTAYEAQPLAPGAEAREGLVLRAQARLAASHLTTAQGETSAGRALADASLALARAANDPKLIVDALEVVGLCAVAEADAAAADAAIEEGLPLARAHGYRWGEAQMLGLLADRARWLHHDFAEAQRYIEAGLELQRELGNPWVIGLSVYSLAIGLAYEGQSDKALEVLAEAEALFVQMDNYAIRHSVRSERAHIERRRGRYAAALTCYAQSLPDAQALGHRAAVARDLECVAFIAVAQGQHPLAARLFGAAESLREAAQTPMTAYERDEYAAAVAALRAQLDSVAFELAWLDGQRLSMEQAIAEVQALANASPPQTPAAA